MENGLGSHIKRLRQGRGIGLKALATSVKVDPAHLSRIETGKTLPSANLIQRLGRRLKTSPEELGIMAGRLPDDIRGLMAANPNGVVRYLRAMAAAGRISTVRNGNGTYSANEGPTYRVIDLFCGAGGFTQGFVQTGRFHSVFANDFNKWAADTYNANFGPHCAVGDINAFLNDDHAGIPAGDVVIGGPPCQGFSLLNKKREGDPRKQLWQAYMEVVERVRPAVFVMENVPELLASYEFLEIKATAEKLGYQVVAGILNAADYGVAQRRRRAIVIGSRVGKPQLPSPTHFNPAKEPKAMRPGLLPWETVRRAIGELPKPEGTEPRLGLVEPPLDIHFGRTPIPSSVERYKVVPEGGNRFDLLKNRPDLTPACWVRKKEGGTDLFGRLWWDRPAFTIRTEFFKPEKGRYLHPQQHRPITHREAARLQSFPDGFKFTGKKIEIARQIGNAVPPMLARKIADQVLAMLDAALVPLPAATANRS